MTKREFLRYEVLNSLSVKLSSFGYKTSKANFEFIKKTNFGWNKYQLVFLIRDDGWEIKSSLLIRFDTIENLFHQISDFEKKYQKGTPTVGTSIEDLERLSSNSLSFQLSNESQINAIVSDLFELFKNVAIPFFEAYNDLQALDEKLNSNPMDTSLTGDIFKGMKALIIAKLVKRENYDELDKIYHSYYKYFANGFYLSGYQKLKELLNSNLTHLC
ncbi:hypothetical protein [Dyadobacter sp. CY347]|uniref:hypothetical protein n=1 Tax=Dyadobacter sp. CY347 TaxID=2909336 RepID=UPI001F25D3B3|nr:hypothetical protein [Dyadobacter sp. CY347]MCF2490773.1 hypothetical protein [Dyadobacter sp. CY347]